MINCFYLCNLLDVFFGRVFYQLRNILLVHHSPLKVKIPLGDVGKFLMLRKEGRSSCWGDRAFPALTSGAREEQQDPKTRLIFPFSQSKLGKISQSGASRPGSKCRRVEEKARAY